MVLQKGMKFEKDNMQDKVENELNLLLKLIDK